MGRNWWYVRFCNLFRVTTFMGEQLRGIRKENNSRLHICWHQLVLYVVVRIQISFSSRPEHLPAQPGTQ